MRSTKKRVVETLSSENNSCISRQAVSSSSAPAAVERGGTCGIDDATGTPFEYAPYTKRTLERACQRKTYGNGAIAWNTFYNSNTINGYKDRHYILREFTELHAALERASNTTAGTGVGEGKELLSTALSPATTSAAAVVESNSKEKHTEPPLAAAGDSEKTPCQQDGEAVWWLEIGCGVGNAVMPSLHLYPSLHVVGFDISSTAIRLFREKVKEQPTWEASGRVRLAVVDLAFEDVPDDLLPLLPCQASASTSASPRPHPLGDATLPPPATRVPMMFASIIFVLSAVHPSRFSTFARRVRGLVAVGGLIFLRDYYSEDMAQKRFSKHQAVEVDDATFHRSDGTLSHFFTFPELRGIFCEEEGFAIVEEKLVERSVENRKDNAVMNRKWCQLKILRI